MRGENRKNDKKRKENVFLGLLVFLVFLYLISSWGAPPRLSFADGPQISIDRDGGDIGGSEEAENKIWNYFSLALKWVQRGGLAICAISLGIGGIIYGTAYGNEMKSIKGKKAAVGALTGAAIIILAVTAIRILASLLGAQFDWRF